MSNSDKNYQNKPKGGYSLKGTSGKDSSRVRHGAKDLTEGGLSASMANERIARRALYEEADELRRKRERLERGERLD